MRVLVLGGTGVAGRLPGAWGRPIRRGDALLAGDVAGRRPTYDEWLERKPTGWTAPPRRPPTSPADMTTTAKAPAA
jgi:hypothetical protein